MWQTACELFYREGIRSVGVAEIAERSGVGKPNLYRNFASKDGLVLAYIAAKAAADQAVFEAARQAHPDDPAAQLRQVIAAVAAVIRDPGYRGCPLANAAVEFPNPDHPVLAAVATLKAERLSWLTELATKLAVREPQRMAYMIQLLLEGAAASAQVLPPEPAACALMDAVDRIIESCRQYQEQPSSGEEQG